MRKVRGARLLERAGAYSISDGGGAPGADGAAHAATDPGAFIKTDRETDPGADAKTDGVRRQPHRPAEPCADAETDSEFDDGRADAPDDAARFATDRRPELRADRQDVLCAVGRPRPARRHAAREPPGDEQRDAAALALRPRPAGHEILGRVPREWRRRLARARVRI